MSTVIIVDDHPLIRTAVRILLENNGHTVVAEASNGVEAIQVVRSLGPDIVILDLDIPRLDGLSVLGHFKSSGFTGKTLVLTTSASSDFSVRCLKAGAAGFISKGGGLDNLTDAVRGILSGLSYFPSKTILRDWDNGESRAHLPSASLTNREITILRLLIKGQKNCDIATTLLISHKTVSTYKSRLLRKFDATNLIELVEAVRRANIV